MPAIRQRQSSLPTIPRSIYLSFLRAESEADATSTTAIKREGDEVKLEEDQQLSLRAFPYTAASPSGISRRMRSTSYSSLSRQMASYRRSTALNLSSQYRRRSSSTFSNTSSRTSSGLRLRSNETVRHQTLREAINLVEDSEISSDGEMAVPPAPAAVSSRPSMASRSAHASQLYTLVFDPDGILETPLPFLAPKLDDLDAICAAKATIKRILRKTAEKITVEMKKFA